MGCVSRGKPGGRYARPSFVRVSELRRLGGDARLYGLCHLPLNERDFMAVVFAGHKWRNETHEDKYGSPAGLL